MTRYSTVLYNSVGACALHNQLLCIVVIPGFPLGITTNSLVIWVQATTLLVEKHGTVLSWFAFTKPRHEHHVASYPGLPLLWEKKERKAW